MRHVKLRRLPLHLTALAVFAITLFPVYWMAVTAFKPTADITADTPVFLPTDLTLEHFRTAVGADGFARYWRNSLLVTVSAVLLSLLVALGAAFAVARMRWRGRRAFVLMVFVAQMAPWEAMLIPVYVFARDVGMLDRLSTLTLVYFMVTLPFTVIVLRGFLAGVPVELEEAAQVDGCTRAGAFRRVTFPLLAAGFAAGAVKG